MKNKLLLVSGLILLVLMISLSYTLYKNDQQRQQQLLQSQQAAQKQIADLNDRLVAVARQQAVNNSNSNAANAAQPIRLSPSQQMQFNQQRNSLWLQQRQWTLNALDMAQDHLRQGHPKKAQQLLLELQQNLIENQQDLGDVFNNTLLQTLKIDQLNIAQQATRQQQTRAALNQSLLQIQQQLNLLAVQAPAGLLTPSSSQNGSGISRWFKQLILIEPAAPHAGQHMLERNFIAKQASINVAIARLALAQSDQVSFSTSLNEALSQLYLLPDASSRQIARKLDKLKNQPWPDTIELTSLTLLSGQKGTP